MPVEKILGNIRAQLRQLTPLLDTFVQPSLQPTVEECTELQKNLCTLQELLAVYRHSKQNYEVSPSFSLHAHISEAAELLKNEAAPVPEEPEPEKRKTPPAEEYDQPATEEQRAARPLQVGLNDKFRFINELFAHNDAEYNIAIEQLRNLQTWSETDLYLTSLKNLYGWRDNQDAVKYFYSLVRKRFQ